MNVGAVILCGGESRRMGRPKAWLPFGTERLLQRVVRLVGAAASPQVVVAAPGQELPPLPASVILSRDPVRGRGPLQGLAAGLAALPADIELAFLTSTDVPFLKPAWIARLAELMGDQDLAIPHAAGFYHPLSALYRRGPALAAIGPLLLSDRPGPVFLMDRLRTRVVAAEELRSVDPELQTLQNLNTVDDYQRALAAAGLELQEQGVDLPAAP